jgi:hypothetical protein
MNASVEISRCERRAGGKQTIVTVRADAKQRLMTLRKHVRNPRSMADITSDALDAVTIPELTKLGLIS